jgi:hypothetical protein
MRNDLIEEFIATAYTLSGKLCWGIAAAANTGPVIDLALGKKLPRRHLIPNPALSEDLRQYYSELSVFVECAWRLDAEDKVVCGWGEDFSGGGPLSKGLNLVLNHTVERVTICRPAFDLVLHFENGLVLQVFCDQTESSGSGNNYVLFTPEHYYVVSSRSQLLRKERSELEQP